MTSLMSHPACPRLDRMRRGIVSADVVASTAVQDARGERSYYCQSRLVAQLLARSVHSLLRLGLLPREEFAHPLDHIVGDDKACADDRLAIADQAVLADLLLLGAKDAEDVLLALGALPQWEGDDRLALVEQLARRLLDHGEPSVEAREG